jgi:hypothetical protein
MKRVDPKAVRARVAKPQPASREASGERSGRPRHHRRNTNWQRGRARAMSVLENAKSDPHRKTRKVEPDGRGRKFTHLTRGDLLCESMGGVSRGRSSEDAGRKAGRAKAQRTKERASASGLWRAGAEVSETEWEWPRPLPAGRLDEARLECRAEAGRGGRSLPSQAKGGGRRCSKA